MAWKKGAMGDVWVHELSYCIYLCNDKYISTDFLSRVLISCKLDGFILQPWYIVLSPLWIVSIVFLIILSLFILISSEGMVKEDDQQRYYRRLRTGYAISSLFVAVLVEILSILWLEGILNTFVIVVLTPYYLWTLFYISKLVILYTVDPINE